MKLKTFIVYKFNQILKYLVKFKILDNDESIKIMINSTKSLARYGDGELTLMLGGSINFQESNIELANRLKDILICEDSTIIIGIPKAILDVNEFNNNAKLFWDQNMNTGRIHWVKLCNLKKEYCNSSMTRLFIDYEKKDKSIKWIKEFKKIWNDKSIIIVEGSKSKLGVDNNLFDNCNSIKRIIAPSKNAYSSYNEILRKVKKYYKKELILISLGPTATVLAYDLNKLGIRTLDIGHIQLEYNEFYKYLFLNNLISKEKEKIISNKEYYEQIICTIS